MGGFFDWKFYFKMKNDIIASKISEAIILCKKNKVEVNICGKSLVLIANESEDYIEKISSYINKKMCEIKNTHNASYKSLLLSINIADELFKEREKTQQLQKNIEKLKIDLAKANYKTKMKEQKNNKNGQQS